jgi:hypothetical protein
MNDVARFSNFFDFEYFATYNTSPGRSIVVAFVATSQVLCDIKRGYAFKRAPCFLGYI